MLAEACRQRNHCPAEQRETEEHPNGANKIQDKDSSVLWVSELPIILASSDLGFLLCQDAHNVTHRSEDLALSITKHTAYVIEAKKLPLSIRKICAIC